MTYYLTSGGIGIATDATPVSSKGKVSITFEGYFADCVSVAGKFYPIVDGQAEIPADDVVGILPMTAYALGSRLRYTCDPLGRIGERGELIAPVRDSATSHITALAATCGALEARLSALEGRILALAERIDRPAFSFGGTV